MSTGTEELDERAGVGWRSCVALAAMGLVAGVVMTWGMERYGAPKSCEDLLYDSAAGAILRTPDDPELDHDDAEGALSCHWRAVRNPDYRAPRCAALTVEAQRRPWLRPRGPVERLRVADGWRARVRPPGLGVDAVVVSRADGATGARAEARVVDSTTAYTLTLACARADRATAAYLTELAARQVVYGGRQP